MQESIARDRFAQYELVVLGGEGKGGLWGVGIGVLLGHSSLTDPVPSVTQYGAHFAELLVKDRS